MIGFMNSPGNMYLTNKTMKTKFFLGVIQCVVALIGMVTQIIILNGHGISEYGDLITCIVTWCGVILFGLSGSFGIVASLTQTKGWITASMIISIIAALFFIPFFSFSYMQENVYRNTTSNKHAMYAIQMAISIAQIFASTSSSVLACRSICNCCRRNEESGTIHYSHAHQDNDGIERLTAVNTQSAIFKPTQEYNNVPMREMERETSAMAQALPGSLSMNGVPTGSLVSFDYLSKENNGSFTQDPLLESNSNSFANNRSKWQRFE